MAVGLVLRISVIVGLGLLNSACSLIVGLYDIDGDFGSTAIDEIVREDTLYEGPVPSEWVPSPESSLLSKSLRSHLLDRAQQGSTAVETELSQAGAVCQPGVGNARRCELRRFRVYRVGQPIAFAPRRTRQDWIISVAYDRDGSTIKNLRVTYTKSVQKLD